VDAPGSWAMLAVGLRPGLGLGKVTEVCMQTLSSTLWFSVNAL
jgi:hypothetical protein